MSKIASVAVKDEEAIAAEGNTTLVTPVSDLVDFEGDTLEDQVGNLIQSKEIVVFCKKSCPFCLDVVDFLTQTIGVRIHTVNIDEISDGASIYKHIKAITGHKTVPAVFIKGKFVGGCDTVKSLHAKDELSDLVGDLVIKSRVHGAEQLDTAQLVPRDRGEAMNPPLWFPNTINNYVVRIVGVLICGLCIVSIIFREDDWGQWISAGLLVDFSIRASVGSALSPLGMIATVLVAPFEPQFKPGPPKQFAAGVGVVFTLAATWCYFSENLTAGAVILGVLAGFAFLEGFIGYCFGCEVFMFAIEMGLAPKSVYRIYTSTLQELKDTWAYTFLDSKAPKPEIVDTDPANKIALRYKKKTDEWTKDDFHLIRNMLPCYFAIPLQSQVLVLLSKLHRHGAMVYA